jgi:membrane-anchored protein YejM (alkaline phosphatase superfamily)
MSTSNKFEFPFFSKFPINYIFFSFYFFFITLIHLYNVFLIEPSFTFSKGFFLLYALGQCAIETLVLIILTQITNALLGIKGLYPLIFLIFFLLIAHVIDFPLVRFIDVSFWSALHFMTQENSQNFLEILYASNVPVSIWIFSSILALWTLFLGILFYRFSERWARQKPLTCSYLNLSLSLAFISLLMFSWDYMTQENVPLTQFGLYQKSLPWKDTFLSKNTEFIAFNHPLKDSNWEKPPLKQIPLVSSSKPDIFLFIVESLREDFINMQNSPNLTKFKINNISFDLALSNANATHISWFSLFYSQFPLYWGKTDEKGPKKGSPPLQLLKQMGYSIHTYSSARLSFYQMGELIFGENFYLGDDIVTFEDNAACARDRKVMDALIREMNNSKTSEGRLFVIFLDSTHFDYSWPESTASHFEPCEELNYFKAALTNSSVSDIKSRYRNALYYVDSLFEEFFDTLNSYKGKNEAVVVITGDHGEEFYEQGNLFHASCLSNPQIHVPLYYKFGNKDLAQLEREQKMSCHMDIFPTLFHHLLGEDLLSDQFQGQSIFHKDRWPFTVVARFNASRPPCEFCIHSGEEKLTASFSDKMNTFNSKGLKIISTKDLNDQNTPHNSDSVQDKFGPAFERIFPKKGEL